MMSEPVVREVAHASRNGDEISSHKRSRYVVDCDAKSLDVIRGQRLGSLPGGFLVNFLCKENWNVDTVET